MPQVTVYVRSGDLERWKRLDNKSEAIANMLHNRFSSKAIDSGVKQAVHSKTIKGKACKEHGVVGCIMLHKR